VHHYRTTYYREDYPQEGIPKDTEQSHAIAAHYASG
jgi:hypothetical protein